MQVGEPSSSRFIFIVAMARSGTHFLGSILQKEPWIRYLDEIFNETLARNAPFNFTDFLSEHLNKRPSWTLDAAKANDILDKFWTHLASNIPEDHTILIDVKEEHLRIVDWPPILLDEPPRLLQSILRLKCPIIHCRRQNLLEHYASIRLAEETGQWILRSEADRKSLMKRLHLCPDKFLRHVNSCRTSEALMNQWLAGHARIAHLTYEMLVEGPQLSAPARAAIEAAVGRTLSLDATARTRKQAAPLHEMIENICEIEAALRDA